MYIYIWLTWVCDGEWKKYHFADDAKLFKYIAHN
jgi:hypothetical protein